MNEKFANIIRQRVYQRVPIQQLEAAGITEFYVGGNSLNKNPPNDIDVFPVADRFAQEQANALGKIVSNTKNAITVKVTEDSHLNHQTVDGTNEIVNHNCITVQLCNYQHNSLQELVDSFDFAHIQIGAKVSQNNIEIYYTPAYEEAKLCQSTDYRGSEYPISSLIRMFKYAKRGDFAGNSHIFSVLKVLTDIAHRGFNDFDDFKDQLDAVDLGLVPDDIENMAGIDSGLNFSEESNNVLNKLMNVIMLGKKAIQKDASISYEYAVATNERFLNGENVIKDNVELSLSYAAKVVKGRFELAEKNISKETKDIYRYYNILKQNNVQMPEDLHNIMLAHALNKDYYATIYFNMCKAA